MRIPRPSTYSALLLGGVALATTTLALHPARANERHFTYTYETGTLPSGAAEIEPWTTIRTGRDGYYLRLDHRLEFEMGLTDNLQGSVYFNLSSSAEEAGGVVEESFAWEGISTEFKYKLLDPVAQPLGFALYGEATVAPLELELEGKALFDKRFQDVLVALNLVYAYGQERELDRAEYERESELESDLGVSYFLSDEMGVGGEFRTHSEIKGGTYEHTAFFVGPTFSFAQEHYWVAMSALFQLGAIKGAEEPAAGTNPTPDTGSMELHDHERFNGRILVGFRL